MPYQNWWRWAGRGRFPVATIEADRRFVRGLPDWKDLVLTWNELQTLPGPWQAAPSQWRGIYFKYDTERRAGYVSSAYGSDNILGRWMRYAETGHGRNRELRKSNPSDLVFSILPRTSPDIEANDVVAPETS